MKGNLTLAALVLIGSLMAGCTQTTQAGTPTLEAFTATATPFQEIATPTPSGEAMLGSECAAFPQNLDSCTEYTCQFTHPLTGELMERRILGISEGRCAYVEQMPNGGKMECGFTESTRKAAAQYYMDVAAAAEVGTEVSADLGSGDIETRYTIDGREVDSPLEESFAIGECTISGYS
ncbi:MAG: hypothetical protein V1787_04060 [Candidatus Micrarchaeota archaeon]